MDYQLDAIIGLTPTKIDATDKEIRFEFSDGSSCVFYHSQECCEIVTVEDVNGDWSDLLNTPLLVADERVSDRSPPGSEQWDSDTWTFYTFRSIKGSVDVRWHGSSNGYYSESVDFHFDAPTGKVA